MDPRSLKISSAIFTLAPLTSELPLIQSPQGRFVPLRALCEIVGLQPSAYIGVFCQRFRPRTAIQQLLWESPIGRQKVWCLEQKYLPWWLVKVPVSHVPPDRRAKLIALQEECERALGVAHQVLIEGQGIVRRTEFRVLAVCANLEQRIKAWAEEGSLFLPESCQQDLAKRLAQGHHLGEALAASARMTLQEVLAGPVVDGLLINEGVVEDTRPIPLLPVVQELDPTTLSLLQQLEEWVGDFTKWWDIQLS